MACSGVNFTFTYNQQLSNASGPSKLLFAPLKWPVDSNEEMEMATRDWLRIEEPDFCSLGTFEFMPRSCARGLC
jgi:hypothetical protein